MSHSTMLFILHVNGITCQNFNLSHIYHIFAEKNNFLKYFFQIHHMISKRGSNCVKWHGSIYFQFSERFKFIKIVVGIYLCFLVHRNTTFIFTNILQSTILQNEMKWSNFFFNILPRLYSNIICKNIVKFF
jgi:hypothetical protein